MKQTFKISPKKLRQIVQEELMREAKSQVAETESHEISAAANSLLQAIKAFNEEELPEVPEQLSSCLTKAERVLNNMSDNPGQYKGASSQSGQYKKTEEGGSTY